MQDQFKALGKDVSETRLEHMRAQMASFKEHLEGFALKHRCRAHIRLPVSWMLS